MSFKDISKLKNVKHKVIKDKNKDGFEFDQLSIISYLIIDNKKILIDINSPGYVFRERDYDTYKFVIKEYPKDLENESLIFQSFMKDVLHINSRLSNRIVIAGFKKEVFEEKLQLLIFK